MGITALLGNASMGLWETSAMMAQVYLPFLFTCLAWCQRSLAYINVLSQVTEAFKARVPQILLISLPYRRTYNYLLILLFLLALSTFLAGILVASFLFATNPRSKRHWRHMTPGVYLLLISQFLVCGFFIYWGVTVAEYTFVIAPLIGGTGSLICVPLMRKSMEGKGEGMGVDKLDAEEKTS